MSECGSSPEVSDRSEHEVQISMMSDLQHRIRCGQIPFLVFSILGKAIAEDEFLVWQTPA